VDYHTVKPRYTGPGSNGNPSITNGKSSLLAIMKILNNEMNNEMNNENWQ